MKCTHESKGNSLWAPTGRRINELNEYRCKDCGVLHLASKEEEVIGRFFPEPLKKNPDDLENKNPKIFEEAFRVFGGKDVEVIQKRVRIGGTSATIYVPKRYRGCYATIVLWLDKEME